MSLTIAKASSDAAYDLIYPDYLASMPESHQEIMQRSIKNSSRVWIGYEDDKVLCIWGLIAPTLLSDRAYLWLFTTPHLKSHVFVFIRHSQRVVAEMLKDYPLIVGHTDVGNDKAIRWIKWAGGVFGEPQGALIPFEIRAKDGSL